MRLRILLAAMVLSMACASSAAAAVITRTFVITAFSFNRFFGPSVPPVDPLQAKFVITFDDTLENTPTKVGVTVKSLNFPALGPTKYAFNPAGTGYLAIGTAPSLGAGFSISGPGYYGIQLWNIFSHPQMGYAQYYSSSGGDYYTFRGTLTISNGLSGAPEPSTWAILILGLGIVGASLRDRHASSSRSALAASNVTMT